MSERFRRWIALALIFFPVIVRFRDFTWWIRWWTVDPLYFHGPLAAAAAVTLGGWRTWEVRLEAERSDPSWFGFAMAGTGLMVWGWAIALRAAVVIGWLIVGRGLAGWAWGTKGTRVTAGPLLILATTVPLPFLAEVTALAQSDTARMVAWGFEHLGIPAQAEGVRLHVGAATVLVGEGCSGMRSVVSMMTTAAAWFGMMPSKWTTRWVVAGLLLPVVLIGNVVRVAAAAWAASRWGEAAALGVWHGWSGWLTFVGELAILGAMWWWLEMKKSST